MRATRRLILTGMLAVPLALGTARQSLAQTPMVYANDGLALDGTDVVAYFTQGAPVPGKSEYAHRWNGAEWHFASAENRDAFAAAPERYAPQYGGYCAWAVSEGYTASSTPEAWEIVDGKLYLNYSRRIQRRWERDIAGHIAAADANWPSLLD